MTTPRHIPVPLGLTTTCCVMEPGALAHAPTLLAQAWPGRPVWIIADGNTWPIAGKPLADLLRIRKMQAVEPMIFPGQPVLDADIAHAEHLLRHWPGRCIPVAVGSGTLNDLVKHAAGRRKSPYVVIPTAASVDGYTASGAALLVEGAKRTMPCPAPTMVIADEKLLLTAPPAMFAAGYADLMAKLTAGADWLLADAIGQDPVDPAIWSLVQSPLRAWLALPAAVGRVFHGLAVTGYAMQQRGDSRPASGAEHLVSHVWEMEGVHASHGFKVAVATVAITRLYEALCNLDAAALRQRMTPGRTRQHRLRQLDTLLSRGCYGPQVVDVAMGKFLEGDALARRREHILSCWDELAPRLRGQLHPLATLQAMLQQVGAPTSPSDIGLEEASLPDALARAQLIRHRYTVLDLIDDLGLQFGALLDGAARRPAEASRRKRRPS